jgi:hypothetical protein
MEEDIQCSCVECVFIKKLIHFAEKPLKCMSVFREDSRELDAEEFLDRMERRANTEERSLYFN